MSVTVYLNDGSKVVLQDSNFDAEQFKTEWQDHAVHGFTIGGSFWTRHAIQCVLPEGIEKVYPNREGQ